MRNSKIYRAGLTTTVMAVLLLTGCSPTAGAADPAGTAGAATNSPATTQAAPGPASTTTAPAEAAPTEAPADELVADEFSQVVNGTLYQGTQSAPVRIGADVPGQPPAVEAGVAQADSMNVAEANDKYLVYVTDADEGGYHWKVFGMSQHGSFRALNMYGYLGSPTIPTFEAAVAGPFTVDGRTLDRAEYLLVAVP